MIEKIDIKDASIAEAVRKNMAVATDDAKGLLDANSNRFVKSSGIHITEAGGCIKLYSGHGQTSVKRELAAFMSLHSQWLLLVHFLALSAK